jgi:prepilin-type N-terminal cleavage/methylation domain-containing protein
MKKNSKYTGLTLVELLVAVAIVAALSAGLYIVGDYANKQAKIKFTESTIQILSTAIEQYHDFYGKFPFQATTLTYDRNHLQAPPALIDPNSLGGLVTDNTGVALPAANYNNLYASSEALYYFLNKCPDAKTTIASLNPSLVTNKDDKNREYFFVFTGDTTVYPLRHIVDAWKTPFRYTYTTGDNFPLIESAGPDKDFNKTDDNISSRKL